MTPFKNDIIVRIDKTYIPQKSAVLVAVTAEETLIVEHIGPKVEHCKVGDRVVANRQSAKALGDGRFVISEDDILAIYE